MVDSIDAKDFDPGNRLLLNATTGRLFALSPPKTLDLQSSVTLTVIDNGFDNGYDKKLRQARSMFTGLPFLFNDIDKLSGYLA